MSEHSEAPPVVAAKLIVSGGFGVGKTTFVGAVSEVRPLTTEAPMTEVSTGVDRLAVGSDKTTTTVALDFGRITIDPTVIVYLFGTPGQDRFGFMWEDLAVGALGAVVLADVRRIEESYTAVDYFEDRGIPFVVAINHFPGSPVFEQDELREALGVDDRVPIVSCDARDREDVKVVLLTLLQLLLRQAAAAAAV